MVWIWDHFIKIDKKDARCKTCKKILKRSGGTKGLSSHLSSAHGITNISIARRLFTKEQGAIGDGEEEQEGQPPSALSPTSMHDRLMMALSSAKMASPRVRPSEHDFKGDFERYDQTGEVSAFPRSV